MGGRVKKIVSSPTRAITAVVTGGGSELARLNPVVNKVGSMLDKGLDYGVFGKGQSFGNSAMPGGQSSLELLISTGGAPLLTNIALGASIDDILPSYLGISKNELLDAMNGENTILRESDVKAIKGVYTQLKQIQSNTDLKNKAVQQVVNDFPNLVEQGMQKYGNQFDENTRKYVDQAFANNAAKFAAGGNLSSGAMNEATARVGAELGMDRLKYSNEQSVRDASLRLAEVNALRDFQNTMLGAGVNQGFSAQQANLQRQFQGQAMNAEFKQQDKLADQASKNALFGAAGSLAGTVIGGSMFGPIGAGVGGKAGGDVLGSFNKNAPTTYSTSYNRILGGK